MALYQFLLLGLPTAAQVKAFTNTLKQSLGLFGFQINRDFTIAQGIPSHFNELTPTVVVFFGADGARYPEEGQLGRLGVSVVPVVSTALRVDKELPVSLRSINALISDPKDTQLVSVVDSALQCLALLPAQRRVFVSYRRKESSEVASQLFEALSARHFDVFLDTHSVAVAADFQQTLWHRLCDSDVLVMLDTPDYFNSRWTTEEWGKAISKHISILQLVWPGHSPSKQSGLAKAKQLVAEDFSDARLVAEKVGEIALEIERIRSVSVALRHSNLVGSLRSAIEDLGGSVEGVGQKRSVILKMPSGDPLVVYPVVGVPTSMDMHHCDSVSDARPSAVIYDHLGISNEWTLHLNWLSSQVKSVKWIKSREVGWMLADIGV